MYSIHGYLYVIHDARVFYTRLCMLYTEEEKNPEKITPSRGPKTTPRGGSGLSGGSVGLVGFFSAYSCTQFSPGGPDHARSCTILHNQKRARKNGRGKTSAKIERQNQRQICARISAKSANIRAQNERPEMSRPEVSAQNRAQSERQKELQDPSPESSKLDERTR